jgi:hypothetical protein
MGIKELLDEAKRSEGVKSDYALAKTLQLSVQRISEYYSRKAIPNEFACLQIARVTGRDFLEVTALVRHEAETNETRRQAWAECLQSLTSQGDRLMEAAVTKKETAPEGAASERWWPGAESNCRHADFQDLIK